MERKQMLVRLLDGKTLCLQIPCATVSGEALKEFLFARTGIPLCLQRLVSGLREIGDETLISASEDGAFPSCSLLLRLRGGKGGFGVLLRSAAARDGHQKTTNYDACRDLSGRRLRHANAEKRLEDWKADADGRKLEKLADQFLAGKTQRVGKASSEAVAKYMDKYEESARRMEEVEESVRRSFQLYQTLKRKALPSSGSPWKRRRSESESESDSEDEDDEDLHKSSANTAC